MKRWLLLVCVGCAALAVRARRPGECFDLPCTVEHGEYVVAVETPAGLRRFAFDAGASRTCISGALCRELGLQAVGRDAMTDFEGHRSTVGRVTMSSLRLGEAVRDDLPVCVVPDSSYVFRCLGLDGIVGGDPCTVVRGEIRGDKPEIAVERRDGTFAALPIRDL